MTDRDRATMVAVGLFSLLLSGSALADRNGFWSTKPTHSYNVQGSMHQKGGLTVKVTKDPYPVRRSNSWGFQQPTLIRSGNLRQSKSGNTLARIKNPAGKTEAMAVYNPWSGKVLLNVAGKRIRKQLPARMGGEKLFRRLSELVPTVEPKRHDRGGLREQLRLDPRQPTYVVKGSMNNKEGIKVSEAFGSQRLAAAADRSRRGWSAPTASDYGRTGHLRMSKSGKILATIKSAAGKTEALAVYNPWSGKTAYTVDGKRRTATLPKRIANENLFKQLTALVGPTQIPKPVGRDRSPWRR